MQEETQDLGSVWTFDSHVQLQFASEVHWKVATRSNDTQSCWEPDLTGGAVGQAGLIVCSQVEISGTGTFVSTARRQKTEVAASSVGNLALMFRN